MQIVFDTNVIRDNAAMRGPLFEALKAFAAMPGYSVVIPQVVIEELVAHLKTEVDDIQARIAKFKRTTAFAGEIAWEDAETLDADEIRVRLVKRFEAAGFEVAPIPDVSHADVLTRIHGGLKPFGRGEREKGYRDYLIWRTALACADDGGVVLVSENTRDFTDKSGDVHPDLTEELGARPLTLRDSLGETVDKVVRPVLDTEAGLLPWFERWVESGGFEDYLGEALPLSTITADVDWEMWDFPTELDDLELYDIVDMANARVDSIERISGVQMLVRVTTDGDFTFRQDLDPWTAQIVEEQFWEHFDAPSVSIDPKLRHAEASLNLEGTASFELLVELDEDEPWPVDIEVAEFASTP